MDKITHAFERNIIPEMTDAMGKYWHQPDRKNILIDDTHAAMSERDFESLADYSRSVPSGVYPGKMWKLIMQDGRKLLCWFSGEREGRCNIFRREILII